MFDYSTTQLMQCTPEEVRVGRCTPYYSFIGNRYENIFPLKEIIENKHVTCPVVILESQPPLSQEYEVYSSAHEDRPPRRLPEFLNKLRGGTRKIKKSRKSRKIKKIKNKISSFFKVFSKRK